MVATVYTMPVAYLVTHSGIDCIILKISFHYSRSVILKIHSFPIHHPSSRPSLFGKCVTT